MLKKSTAYASFLMLIPFLGHATLYELEIESLKSRTIYIPFSAKGKKYTLVRATEDDKTGMELKNNAKTNEERIKFTNQFGLSHGLKILETYKKLSEWNIPAFKDYKFGLFSIYQLNESNNKASYVGELNLDESNLSTNGNIEASYDIEPTMRNQGIAKATMLTVMLHIFKPLEKTAPWQIDYASLCNKQKAISVGFKKSTKALSFIKLKIGPDNLYSTILANRLNFQFYTLGADSSVVYSWPPQKSPIPELAFLQLMPFIKNLISSNENDRQIAIQTIIKTVERANEQK